MLTVFLSGSVITFFVIFFCSVWLGPESSGLPGTRFLVVEVPPLREDEGWFAEDGIGTFAWIVFFLVVFAFPGMLVVNNLLSVRFEEEWIIQNAVAMDKMLPRIQGQSSRSFVLARCQVSDRILRPFFNFCRISLFGPTGNLGRS